MSQVLLHLSFRNTQYPRKLICGHPRVGQDFNNALAERAFGGRHVRYDKDRVKEKPNDLRGASTNRL